MLQVVIALVALAVLVAAAFVIGNWRWERETEALRSRLVAARMPVEPRTVDFTELDSLPPPVQRCFRAVLRNGQPMISGVRVRHRGTFNMSEGEERWTPFTSDQLVVVRRPGFVWSARMPMVAGVPVRVHDAYVAGQGLLRAKLLGLVPVMSLEGAGDLAVGEFMRFVAEAAWYPTALLPSQGVRWEPVDNRSARATLGDGAVSVTLTFEFDGADLIETVRADARGRMVGGRNVPTPWQGRFWNYAERDGMRIPLEGEVAWVLPEGPRPYWLGTITDIVYELGR